MRGYIGGARRSGKSAQNASAKFAFPSVPKRSQAFPSVPKRGVRSCSSVVPAGTRAYAVVGVQGTTVGVQGTTVGVQGTTVGVQGTTVGVQGTNPTLRGQFVAVFPLQMSIPFGVGILQRTPVRCSIPTPNEQTQAEVSAGQEPL